MPLKTFFNLKTERQREIIDVCLEEFGFNDYNEASLNRIIKKLGIAKGSFYRYFENKKDLYEYLIKSAKKLNQTIFNQTFKGPVEDILEAWVNFYLAAVKLDNEYPLFSYFGYKVFLERNNVILGNVALKSKEAGIKLLKNLFKQQQDKDLIRKDIDVDLMIFTLLQINEGFLDYLTIKHNIDFKENIKKRNQLFSISLKTIKKELEGFASIIREGIRR